MFDLWRNEEDGGGRTIHSRASGNFYMHWCSCCSQVKIYPGLFLPRDALVHSAVLRLHVVRPSVCPSVSLSVTLVDQDHIGWNLGN